MQTSFTTTQLSKMLGLSVRRIIAFEERGYVSPSIQAAAGRGSQRLWSYEDVVRLVVIKKAVPLLNADQLRQIGQSMKDPAVVGPTVGWFIAENTNPAWKTDAVIIYIWGDDPLALLAERLREHEQASAGSPRRQPVGLFINFADLHRIVRELIDEL